MHTWLSNVTALYVGHYHPRPKENVADTLIFVAVVVFLVLLAGLMSGDVKRHPVLSEDTQT